MKTRLLNGVRYKKLNLGGYGQNTPSSQDENYVKEEKAKLASMDNFGNVAGGVGAAFNPVVGAAIKGVTAGSSALLKDTVDDKGFKKDNSTFKTGLAYTLTPTASWIQNIDRGKNWDKLSNEGKAASVLSIVAPWTGSIADKEISDKAKKEYEEKVGQYYKDSFAEFSKSKIDSGEVNLQGNAGARMFKYGGIHIKPENVGKFTETKERTGKTTEELTHSSNPITRKRAIFAQNAAKWHHKENGGITEELQDSKTIGGKLKKLSNNSLEVDGRTHAEGGVKIPSKGVEVEDGETIKGDFVFSDKLGFADRHKKLAKEIGRVEKSPDSNRKAFTLQRLKDQEKQLMVEQESLKENLGMDNDKDNVMSKGGLFKAKFGLKSIFKQARENDTEVPYSSKAAKYGAGLADGNPDDNYIIPEEQPTKVNRRNLAEIDQEDVFAKPSTLKTTPYLRNVNSSDNDNKFSFRNAGRNLAEITPSIVDSISGFSNAQRRLNTPVEQIGEIPKVRFNKVSADASLNEADRQRVGLNKFVQQNIADSNVAASINAGNLASTIAAKNQIYQDVNNRNADIKNDEIRANQAITEKNIENTFANKARRRLATDEAYQDMHDATLNASQGLSVFNRDKKAERIFGNQSLINAAAKMTPEEFASFKSNLEKYGYQKKYGGKLDKMGDGGTIKTIYYGKDKIEANHKDIAEMKNDYPIYKKGSELHKEYLEGMEKAKKEGANYAMIHGYNYLINEPKPKSKNSFADVKNELKTIEGEELSSLPETGIKLFDKTRPNKDTSKSIVEKPKEKAHNSRVYSSGEGFYFLDKDTGRKVSSKSRIGIGIKRLFS